jgi:hypothetical protein
VKTCKGQFSTETVTLLREAYAKYGPSASETFDRHTCTVRGCARLLAKNYGDQWIPQLHYPQPRKLVNPSGKSGHYKR